MVEGSKHLPLPDDIRFVEFKSLSPALSKRFLNAVARVGISNLDELFQRDLREIKKITGVGERCVRELEILLNSYGIDLNHYFGHNGRPKSLPLER